MNPIVDHSRNVLVADDDTEVREMLLDVLALEGYTCSGATSGAEALEVLDRNTIDLVLLDIVMPAMSGLEAFPIIRSRFPDVAVLFVTAMNEVPTAVESMKCGAYDYITKPMPVDAILSKVADALDRRRHRLEERHSEQSRIAELHAAAEVRAREVQALNRLMHQYLLEEAPLDMPRP